MFSQVSVILPKGGIGGGSRGYVCRAGKVSTAVGIQGIGIRGVVSWG